tara:strand:- start:2909 stop:5482 length:2574 start_codon:yes stop_codon:yes gene_type:complete
MRNRCPGKDYTPIRRFMKLSPPCDLCQEDAFLWKHTLKSILDSSFDREIHLGKMYKCIYSKVTCLELSYDDVFISGNVIPNDISKIVMTMKLNTIQETNTLFYFLISSMLLHKRRLNVLDNLFFFLVSSYSSQPINESFKQIFADYIQTYNIVIKDNTLISKGKCNFSNRHLSLHLTNVEFSQTWFDAITIKSNRDLIQVVVDLLLQSNFISDHQPFYKELQNSMTTISKYIFQHSEHYCGIKIKEEVNSYQERKNINTATVINEMNYTRMYPKEEGCRSDDILYSAKDQGKSSLVLSNLFTNSNVVYGVGNTKSKYNYVTMQVDENIFTKKDYERGTFESHNDINSLYEKHMTKAVMYYQMPESCKIHRKRVRNFLVILSPFEISEIPYIFTKFPSFFKGCIKALSDEDIGKIDDDTKHFSHFDKLAFNLDSAYHKNPRHHKDSFYNLDTLKDCKNSVNYVLASSFSRCSELFTCLNGNISLTVGWGSWYATNSDIETRFGSSLNPLMNLPFSVWSSSMVICRYNNKDMVTYPDKCEKCNYISNVMYTYESFNKLLRWRCHICKNFEFSKHKKLTSEYAIICKQYTTKFDSNYDMSKRIVENINDFLGKKTDTLMFTFILKKCKCKVEHIRKFHLYTTGHKVLLENESFLLLDKSTKNNRNFFKGSIMEKRVALKRSYLARQSLFKIPNEWEKLFFVRKRNTLFWKQIHECITSCKCYISWRSAKVGACDDLIKPKFNCCSKKYDFLPANLTDQNYTRALSILGIKDQSQNLKCCEEFCSLYYTLFSIRNEETSLREALSWVGADCIPKQCTFIDIFELDIEAIRCASLRFLRSKRSCGAMDSTRSCGAMDSAPGS